MTVAVRTHAETRRSAILELRRVFRKSLESVPQAELDYHIGEAYRAINRDLSLYFREHSQNTDASASDYPLPPDIIDRMLVGDRALRVEYQTGSFCHPIESEWNDFRTRYGDGSLVTPGAPQHWTHVPESGHKIRMYPKVPASVSGGLVMTYIADPGIAARVFDQETITAAVTNASSGVIFSAAIAAGTFQAGDFFGVRDAAADLPTVWYEIREVTDTTNIVLGRAADAAAQTYDEATRAASLFTISSANPVEKAAPGLLDIIPAHYAAARIAEREGNGALSELQMNKFITRMTMISEGRANPNRTVLSTGNAVRRYASLR